MGEHSAMRGEPTGFSEAHVTRSQPYQRPAFQPDGEPVCQRCRTWLRCCYCRAGIDAMSAGLARLAELHRGHDPCGCPDCARLALLGPRGNEATMRTTLRRIAELHVECVPARCPEYQLLLAVRLSAPEVD